jgi:hypothetical protein
VIDESDPHHEKQFDPRISTLLGIKIDSTDESANASDSIRVKCEFDSNRIDLSIPGSFLKLYRGVGRGQFRKIIESGIQARKIQVAGSEQCVTVLIEPPFTITRRS